MPLVRFVASPDCATGDAEFVPSRLLCLVLILPLFAGCTIAANAEPAPPTPVPAIEQAAPSFRDPVQAAALYLEAAYGPESVSRMVNSVWIQNSVLVVAMTNPPTNLSNVDAYWRVCQTLARTMIVPDIAPGQTALVVIQPNGANVVYAIAGETACKVP